MSRPPVLNLAIVGLSPEWETRYAPTVARLAKRVHVVGVYDSTPNRADQVAAGCQTTSFHGVRQLLKSPGLKGVLLLDTGWHRRWIWTAAASAGLPLFIGQHVLRSLDDWTICPESIVAADAVVVPECLLRYQPSMLRLRELMATQLGPVERVSFSLELARQVIDPQLSLREVCNWFRTTFEVVTTNFSTVRRAEEESGGTTVLVDVPTRTGRAIAFTFTTDDGARNEIGGDSADDQQPFCTVASETGLVELVGPRELRWLAGGEKTAEKLDADRSATDVALDLFSRRAIGGLLPVPDLSHLEQAQRLANSMINRPAGS